MNIWGLESEEEITHALNSIYDEIVSNMSDDELIEFEDFIAKYIEMPAGEESLKQFEAFNKKEASLNDEIYACAAVGIDNFGRNIYNSLGNSTRAVTVLQCRKYYAARIALISVSTILGAAIPGPGWLTAAYAICDTSAATAEYIRCMRGAV